MSKVVCFNFYKKIEIPCVICKKILQTKNSSVSKAKQIYASIKLCCWWQQKIMVH